MKCVVFNISAESQVASSFISHCSCSEGFSTCGHGQNSASR